MYFQLVDLLAPNSTFTVKYYVFCMLSGPVFQNYSDNILGLCIQPLLGEWGLKVSWLAERYITKGGGGEV
jgi:hypothetical protein